MASLIPVLRDIIPIIKPGKVQVRKASSLREESSVRTPGITTRDAIVGMCDTMCTSVMIAHPHSSSAIHHHGEQDTIVYAASGHGTILTNPSLLGPSNLKRYDLSPGDFALIPAWTEHQEVNGSDEDVVWIITGNGSTPVVVNLEDWGGGLSGL